MIAEICSLFQEFSTHVFTPDHLKKIAAEYNIRLSEREVSTKFSCDVSVK